MAIVNETSVLELGILCHNNAPNNHYFIQWLTLKEIKTESNPRNVFSSILLYKHCNIIKYNLAMSYILLQIEIATFVYLTLWVCIPIFTVYFMFTVL